VKLTIADLRYTGVWNAAALQTDDVAAALMSGLQKKRPTFEKL
jgi:delta(3,5)-delta(2,4)-dienoyl-CoA isomerase